MAEYRPLQRLTGESIYPLTSNLVRERNLNPVSDIRNENILQKNPRGGLTMGHLSKCSVLNT